MDIELIEIRDFLAQYSPFSQLDAVALDALARRMAVRHLRRGSDFPPPDEAQPHLYILREGAVERRDASGSVVSKLGEGDLFDAQCFEAAPVARGVTVEDSLFYLLPCTELQALRRQHPRFDDYFGRGVSRRLRLARGRPATGEEARLSLMRQAVAEFARRDPVTAPSSMSIRDAARLMTQERVSALLIVDDAQLAGIVTDRDLRSRCLAADVDAESAVADIMTRDVRSIAPDAAAFEALLSMTRAGVHHLAVIDAGGVRGLVSTTDLTRWQSANPVYLAGTVRRCDTLQALMRASAELPELLVHLVADGAGASQIGQALGSVALS